MRVALLTAEYGQGHVQAARAVKEALARVKPCWRAEIFNFVRLVSPQLDGLTRKFYLSVVGRFPSCYGWFYRITDASHVERWHPWDWLGRAAVERLMRDYEPQLLVATFPTPGRVAADLKMRGRLAVPVAMVVTDHAAHAEWIHPEVDLYLVADAEVRESLLRRGIDPGRVIVSGIPVRLSFSRLPTVVDARRRLGLRPQERVILVTGGGCGGVGALDEICYLLAEAGVPARVVVVAGQDRTLYARLSARYGATPGFSVLGYVENMAELMRAADLLVGKAGALTLAEAACAGLPVVIYRSLPGQEEANARHYERSGMAVRARTARDLLGLVSQILADEAGMGTRMRAAARRLAQPQAALAAAQALARLAEREGEDGWPGQGAVWQASWE